MKTLLQASFALVLVLAGMAWLAADAASAQPRYPRSGRGIVAGAPRPEVTPTARPPIRTPEPGPTATLSLDVGYPRACPGLADTVPQADIDRAVDRPAKVGGWNQPLDANKPVSPANPRRRWLQVQSASKPYHPLFNGLVFKAGCS